MNRIAFYIFLILAASACKSTIEPIKAKDEIGNDIYINYTLNSAKKEKKRKLLLIIPDYGQPTNFYKSSLAEALYDENFQLLIPERRGTDFSTKAIYDVYDERLIHINTLVQNLLARSIIDTSFHFVIYGIGEGSYIAADLVASLQPDYFILQNNGAHHFLHETLQVLNSADSSKIKQIQNTAALSKEDLVLFIEKAQNKEFSNASFYGKKTTGWHSYTQHNLTEILFEHRVPGTQLIDTSYTYFLPTAIPNFIKVWSFRNPKVDTLNVSHPIFSKDFKDKSKEEMVLSLFLRP